jgi:hypothetical protein
VSGVAVAAYVGSASYLVSFVLRVQRCERGRDRFDNVCSFLVPYLYFMSAVGLFVLSFIGAPQ